MAFHAVSTMEKPMQHISLADWYSRVERLRNVADARRADALKIRNSSIMLRNETRIEADWANYESNGALTDRVAELKLWRDVIEKAYRRIELEMATLQKERIATELELELEAGPIAIISEVISVRDCRLGSELTRDEPDTEIKNELYILENNQRLLSNRCQAAFEKLKRLEEVRFKLGLEIENKINVEALDSAQVALDRNSADISFKPDPMRFPQGYRSYNDWLDHVKNMKQLAENELADAVALRESLFVCREKARTLLQAQSERTEYIIRKRVFETQRAFNELKWQQMKMKEEMERAMCEIKTLEDALRDKTNGLKLAETRLENRTLRSSTELCLDEAHDMLCVEVEKLHEIRRCLKAKIDESKANYNLLSNHALKIDEDLKYKQHTLNTDTHALESREQMKQAQSGPKTINPSAQTDFNIKLSRMEDVIPKT